MWDKFCKIDFDRIKGAIKDSLEYQSKDTMQLLTRFNRDDIILLAGIVFLLSFYLPIFTFLKFFKYLFSICFIMWIIHLVNEDKYKYLVVGFVVGILCLVNIKGMDNFYSHKYTNMPKWNDSHVGKNIDKIAPFKKWSDEYLDERPRLPKA